MFAAAPVENHKVAEIRKEMRTNMRWTRLALAVMISAVGLPCGAAEFHVSPSGRDTNPGTEARPFATVTAARDAIRKLIAAGLKDNVTAVLHGGTYYLPEGLVLGPQDSGTRKHSITYTGGPGEAPVLVGGVRITDLKKHKGQIYVAPLPKGSQPKVACENGRRLIMARAPNKGYFSVSRPGKGGSFTYSGDYLRELTGADIADGIVSAWPHYNWVNRLYPLVAIDPKARRVVARGISTRRRNRFYIMNVLALLDEPGECQISTTHGKLYLWPRKGPVGSRLFTVATADNVIAIRGSKGKTVRNVHFNGLDLVLANKDAVYVTSAEGCSFRACRIENAWERGVYIHGAAERITVADSEIRYNGLHGVEMKGLPFGGPYVNKGHVIENNHVHHCGEVIGSAMGVKLSDSGDSRVVHNHIHDMPRYGTSVKGLTVPFMKSAEHKKNRYKYLHSRNNLLAYNYIHHVNLDSEDTGAMQSWGAGRDNVYDHNLIHDVGTGQFTLQSGLYLDDSSDYFTVTNNIVFNVIGRSGSQAVYVKGIGNKIDNNVLVVSRHCSAAIRTKQSVLAYGHEYTHNIIYFENPGAAIYQFDDYKGKRVAKCDNNVYFNPKGRLRIAGRTPYGRSFGQWKRVFDKKTITVDPMFVSAAKHDYRLKPGSRALKIGIKWIDTSKIGLTSKFPKRLDRQ